MTNMTVEYLRECLRYCAESGEFFWNHRPANHFKTVRDRNAWNTKNAGTMAGTIRHDGRIDLCISNVKLRAHRVAWAIQNGSWPTNAIDHIDGNPGNNAIANLRECTLSQNQYNRRIAINNTTGFKGVAWLPSRRKFRAAIRINGRQTHLGLFSTAELAQEAYWKAAITHHGQFTNIGHHGDCKNERI